MGQQVRERELWTRLIWVMIGTGGGLLSVR